MEISLVFCVWYPEDFQSLRLNRSSILGLHNFHFPLSFSFDCSSQKAESILDIENCQRSLGWRSKVDAANWYSSDKDVLNTPLSSVCNGEIYLLNHFNKILLVRRDVIPWIWGYFAIYIARNPLLCHTFVRT